MKKDAFKKVAKKKIAIDTVVIPVAGLGTRALPLTKALPKHFLTVGDKPLIQHAVDEAKQAGVKNFVFIVDDDPINLALLKKTDTSR